VVYRGCAIPVAWTILRAGQKRAWRREWLRMLRQVAYHLAADNLGLGLSVVADSVNPLQLTRAAWRDVARCAGVPFVEIEVVCSNEAEHRSRVEARSTDICELRLPSWEEVVRRDYEPWDAEHLVIDTAGQSVEQSVAALERALAA